MNWQKIALPDDARKIVASVAEKTGRDYSMVELPNGPLTLWEIRQILAKHEGIQ